MAGTIQHRYPNLLHGLVLGRGQRPNVLAHGLGNIQHPNAFVGGDDFFHIKHTRGIEHAAPVGHRDHRNRVAAPGCRERGTVNRVDRDISLRALARADDFAVKQHRRIVFFPLADDHQALEIHGGEEFPHRIDRGLIGRVFVASPNPGSGTNRRGLGGSNQLHRQVPVWVDK